MNRTPLRLPLASLLAILAAPIPCPAGEFDLRPHRDEKTPLANPHKGWYHHYPDNHIDNYRIARDEDLLRFPGMDHLYIRLAWAYLEPREGAYDWPIIDRLIEKWTGHGLGIAFRISCKETSTDRIEQQYATPRWVLEAGAKGGHYRMGQPTGPEGPWEPIFDDPVFLEKLENFLRAFAGRYDGKTWLRYVDIGSVGDWGEGHTWAGSRTTYGYDVLRRHVDLHLKYFKKSQLVASDDLVFSCGGPEDRRRLHRYLVDHGISYRDDSILVDGYFAGHSATATVRSPEFFAEAWPKTPTVLELEHYGAVKKSGNWLATPGSSIARHGGGRTGAEFLREALGILHATYIGYHGYAHEWLADNPELTAELLNRCGYWYFLHRAKLPERLKAGETAVLEMTWENRGVAPAYQPFGLLLRLEGPRTVELSLDAGNRRWMPGPAGTTHLERYDVAIPAGTAPGAYAFKAKLRSPAASRDVLLALDGKLLDGKGFYRIGEVEIGD